MVLRTAVAGCGLDVQAMAEPAATLTDYGVGPRYPMLSQPATAEDAAEAIDAATAIVAWAAVVLGEPRA